MRKIFIFTGPPGSGKGSLSQFCSSRFGWKQLSTGALCRKHIAEQTNIGKQIDFLIKSGKLIPDDLIASLVEEWLLHNNDGWDAVILDGFPRTLPQAQLFGSIIQERLKDCELCIVNLAVPDKIILKRLGGRVVCGNRNCQAVYSLFTESHLTPHVAMRCDKCQSELVRRSDDELSSIEERLRIYHAEAEGVVDFYKRAGVKVHELDVERLPEQVFHDFERLIEHEYNYH